MTPAQAQSGSTPKRVKQGRSIRTFLWENQPTVAELPSGAPLKSLGPGFRGDKCRLWLLSITSSQLTSQPGCALAHQKGTKTKLIFKFDSGPPAKKKNKKKQKTKKLCRVSGKDALTLSAKICPRGAGVDAPGQGRPHQHRPAMVVLQVLRCQTGFCLKVVDFFRGSPVGPSPPKKKEKEKRVACSP